MLSNSDKNCRRRSILKKNHDVTIMTSSGHVTSSESCPIDTSWPLSYRLSFGTIPLSVFISEIFSAKVATTIITWWHHQWRHKAHINYPWGTYRHTIHRNIVLKYRPFRQELPEKKHFFKNHDATIMTSSGHVTSSGSCPIDRSWPLCYRLSIRTILLSGFVSEIFSAKVATTIITWWRYQQPPSWIWWNRK